MFKYLLKPLYIAKDGHNRPQKQKELRQEVELFTLCSIHGTDNTLVHSRIRTLLITCICVHNWNLSCVVLSAGLILTTWTLQLEPNQLMSRTIIPYHWFIDIGQYVTNLLTFCFRDSVTHCSCVCVLPGEFRGISKEWQLFVCGKCRLLHTSSRYCPKLFRDSKIFILSIH